MLETAAWADHDGGESEVGRGYMRLWRALYARAEVEEAVDSDRMYLRVAVKVGVRARIALVGRARMAFREDMMTGEKSIKTPCEWLRRCLTPSAAIGM
jgi:hypothetical protein